MGKVSNADVFDVSEYAGVKKTESADSDSCGIGDRVHATFLRLTTKQGIKGIPYSGIYGLDQSEDGTTLQFTFHAIIEWDGERKDRHFVATIKGKRLETIVRHVSVACRKTIHPSGPVEGEKPQVDSIGLEVFDPDA